MTTSKPLILALQPRVEFLGVRFPVDLKNLTEPVTVEEIKEVLNIIGSDGGAMMTDEAEPAVMRRAANAAPPQPVLKIKDAGSREFKGVKERATVSADNTSAYYVMVDRGTHTEIAPLAGWYSLQLQLEENVEAGLQAQNQAKLIEKSALSKIEALTKRSVLSETGAEESSPTGAAEKISIAPAPAKRRGAPLRKNAKTAPATKKKTQEVANSSLAFGEVNKPEVDWDYDEPQASDDEEGAGVASDDEKQGDEPDRIEDESEEEEQESRTLTTFGQNLTRMLADEKNEQMNIEADEELAQFSDDENENDKEDSATVPQTTTTAATVILQPTNDPQEISMRSQIITLIKNAHGTIPVRTLMEELGLNQKDNKFALVRKVLGDVAEVTQEKPAAGSSTTQAVRYLTLKKGL